MRIGIVVDNEFNNDVRVRRQSEILKTAGFEVSVLCFGFKHNYNDPEGFKITRIYINRKLKNTLFFFQNICSAYEKIWAREISSFIKQHKPEIIHVHDLYMSMAAHEGIIKSGRTVRMILDLHENYPFQVTTYNWTKGFLRNLLSRPADWKKKEYKYLGYADKIVVLSNEYRDVLLKEYPAFSEEKFVVFPNVPDISAPEYSDKTHIGNPFSNGFRVLLYYGVIAERRGIFETLFVFSELVKGGHKVNLLLIGPVDKKDREIFMKIISLDYFKDRVVHIPWIDPKDFPGWLGISDICLAPFRKNPQHESGIANKIYDYMLGGKPLIVSDCLPQKNLVEKYNCGFVFSNDKEFSSAIITLIEDGQMRSSMGRNGQNAIIGFHNTATFRGRLITACHELVPKA